jgi:hypothetical protein
LALKPPKEKTSLNVIKLRKREPLRNFRKAF